MSNNFLIRNQDQTVGGIYRLGAVVRRTAAGVVYETAFGEGALPAVIKIRYVEAQGREQLLAQWRNAIGLSHPNLLRVYAAGFSELDDVPVVYVVMERADASLAGVLAERPLSESEIREVLAPALSALSYLHKNGYAHAGLKPSDIFAVGDQVKLSADNATLMEIGADSADDIRALGVLIQQALRQEPASEALRDLVAHCLEPDPKKRWSLDQVAASLEGRVAEPPPPPAVQAVPVPVAESSEAPEAPPPARRATPKWVFAALAALVLVVLLPRYWRRPEPAPAAVASIRPRAASWTGPEVTAPKPSPVPAPPRKPGSAPPVHEARRSQGWSVVVATYISRDAAEKRQRDLARRWPKFTFGVFQQKTENAQFLIMIGQNLSEDEADTLRKRAVASGIPADTYIKKFQ